MVSTTIQPVENLTPEQRKAVKVVQECLPFWNQFLCSDPSAPDVCCTDSKIFTLQKITYSDLYHGKDWIWNQSNAKKTVLFDNDISVVVQKFNIRKKKKITQTDGLIFKLWMFYVYKHTENSFLGVFVWCEKGFPQNIFLKNEVKYNLVPQQENYYNLNNNYYSNTLIASQGGNNINYTQESFYCATNEDAELYSTENNNLTLEDLDFLKPFMDDQFSFNLGLPNLL